MHNVFMQNTSHVRHGLPIGLFELIHLGDLRWSLFSYTYSYLTSLMYFVSMKHSIFWTNKLARLIYVMAYCEYFYLFFKTEKQTLIPVITEQNCCTVLSQTCYWKYKLEEIVTQTKQCQFYHRLCVVVKKRVSHDGGI